jgi:hypothetical protein
LSVPGTVVKPVVDNADEDGVSAFVAGEDGETTAPANDESELTTGGRRFKTVARVEGKPDKSVPCAEADAGTVCVVPVVTFVKEAGWPEVPSKFASGGKVLKTVWRVEGKPDKSVPCAEADAGTVCVVGGAEGTVGVTKLGRGGIGAALPGTGCWVPRFTFWIMLTASAEFGCWIIIKIILWTASTLAGEPSADVILPVVISRLYWPPVTVKEI